MVLIPVKINDNSPRNSGGQLISIANKYEDGIMAFPCNFHEGIEAYLPNCRDCQRTLKARQRWINYLTKELMEVK